MSEPGKHCGQTEPCADDVYCNCSCEQCLNTLCMRPGCRCSKKFHNSVFTEAEYRQYPARIIDHAAFYGKASIVDDKGVVKKIIAIPKAEPEIDPILIKLSLINDIYAWLYDPNESKTAQELEFRQNLAEKIIRKQWK